MHGWTLVFDLDGTLVDTAPDLAAATNHILERFDLPAVDEKEIRHFVKVMPSDYRRALAEMQAKRATVVAADELSDEASVDIAAAKTAATTSPTTPLGRWLTMKWGKTRSLWTWPFRVKAATSDAPGPL